MPPPDHRRPTVTARPNGSLYFDPDIARSLVRAGIPLALRRMAARCDLDAAQEAAHRLADALDTIAAGLPYRPADLARPLDSIGPNRA